MAPAAAAAEPISPAAVAARPSADAATAEPSARAARTTAGVDAVQTRVLRLLFATQIIGGIGVAIGVSVGALLTADMAGVRLSGLAQSAALLGAALLAVPATRIARQYGRRPSLAAVYLIAALGGATVLAAAMYGSLPLLFLGLFLFGGGSTAGLQARYAAVDLAPAGRRGRHLSLIVWATTLGAVAGPNLAALAGQTLARFGVPTLAGPFFFSALLFGLAASLLLLLLRPDPLLVARGDRAVPDARPIKKPPASSGMRAALGAILAQPAARVGITAMAVGHLVMVGVMAMTPVHILGAGHEAAHTLRIVGVVLSLHIAGMFAFAPVTGWLSDRFGRRPVIAGGSALLLVACAIAGSAGHHPARLALGLAVLGLGWSATMIAGSTLLSESVATEVRASAQGLSDLAMGLAGALAGAFSGFILEAWGYPALTLLAALAAAPLAMLARANTRGFAERSSPA